MAVDRLHGIVALPHPERSHPTRLDIARACVKSTGRMRAITFALAVLLVPSLAAAQEEPEEAPPEPSAEHAVEQAPEGQPRYLHAMQEELTAMGVRGATCEAMDRERGRCTFTARGISTGREFTVHLVYSDRTDTIYAYVERYLVAPADGETTPALMRRLMELNWSMLLGKLEWDSTDGEVRLSMVINTDSNFDRRAFRSAIRAIGQLADRYWGELDRIVRGRSTP